MCDTHEEIPVIESFANFPEVSTARNFDTRMDEQVR